VRSHAKATSVGSNPGPGARLGSIGRLGALLGALAVVVCLLPAFASAAETRPPTGTVGSFYWPGPVAVDQGTHDVYAVDFLGKLERFDENGAPANFSALGTNELSGGLGFYPREALNEIAVDSTSHDFYLAGYFSGVIKAFQQNGEPREFTAGSAAGSNELELPGYSEVCGVAVDSNGDIYMGDYVSGIHVFAPDGEELTSFPASEACNVAVDSSGDVYVAGYVEGAGGVEKFTPSEFPVTSSTTYTSAGQVTGAAAYAIAVDPATGDLYVDEGNKVQVYDSSGAPRYEFAAGIESSEGVAVDDGLERAYAADKAGGTVQVYGPAVPLPDAKTEDATEVGSETALLHGAVGAAGATDATCEFQYATKASYESEGFESAETAPCEPAGPFTGESHSAVTGEATGLAPGTAYRFRLAATNSYGTNYGAVHVFHTMRLPLIESASVEAVGSDNADLSAVIGPEGGATTYRVEFGTTSAYGQSSESATIGFEGDESPHTVHVHVAGLTPGTAYHFRFVATNGAGTTEGEDTSFATYPTPQSFAPCSNDKFRTGFGAELPDCRAYEQATPTDKNGADARGTEGNVEASPSGDRVSFSVLSGLPTIGGSSRLTAFVAARGPEGWHSESVVPLLGPGEEAETDGLNEDLTRTLVTLPPNALYAYDSATGALEPLVGDMHNARADAVAFAADPRHMLIQVQAHLLPEVTGSGPQLYDSNHGKLSYVGRIPAGEETGCDDEAGPACIASPDAAFAGYSQFGYGSDIQAALTPAVREQISRDGSRVFFTGIDENPEETKIYLREDGVRTTWISAPQRSAPDPNGTQRATLWAVTPDGSKAFFTSCEKLTEDSTAVSAPEPGCGADDRGNGEYRWGRGLDLYSYDSGSGKLSDLSVDSNAGDALGADVVSVLGASADGSYVYFAANGVLAPGASPGNCHSSSGAGGTCNLYVAHGGTVSFVAPLSEGAVGDEANWVTFNAYLEETSRVAANGTLLFRSGNSLTGYDNVGSALGDCGVTKQGEYLFIGPCPEFYRYVPTTEQLNCVTCSPAGLAPPKGEPSLLSIHGGNSGFVPGGAPFLTRNLSANGKRVFFQSDDALLPADTNGNSGCPSVGRNRSCKDVYEWEAKGEGSCESESENGGCLYLISSGKSPDPSYFLDASENGDHVFFFTHQQLVPGDKDQLEDVYDASVGGGLASQHALTPPTCAGSACVANPPPPTPQSLSSSSFSGPGNAKAAPRKRSCPKGKRRVRRKGKTRCVARHHRKRHERHHRRHHKRAGHHRAHHKRANVNRGGSK
jgi:hypothetical protein